MALYDKIDETALRSLKHSGKGLYVSYGNKPLSSGDPGIPGPQEDNKNNPIKEIVTSRTDDVIRVTKATTTRNPLFLVKQGFLNFVDEKSGDNAKKRLGQAAKNTALGQVTTLAQTAINGLGHLPNAGKGTFINPGYITPRPPGSQFVDSTPGSDTLTKNQKLFSTTNLDKISRTKLVERETPEIDSFLLSFNPFQNIEVNEEVINYTNGDEPEIPIDNQIDKRFRYKVSVNENNRILSSNKDYINSLDIQTEPLEEIETQIIPFSIQIFDPALPDQPFYIYLRAYLENISDSFTGNWNSTKYLGRAEELYNYTGFSRRFSFGFKIAAHSEYELRPLYAKLSTIAATTAPSYNENQGFMRGVFSKITIGDYVTNLPGFFTSVNLDWNTTYPWEVGVDREGNSLDLPRVPHILDVKTEFQPVHDFNPSFQKTFFGPQPSSGDVTIGTLTATGGL